ncbi:MAG TPA: DUF5103 domain-containing protein [Microscillaceae bacterium]|jgi:hypothetical protein|nr:DUF5103 domain-containing protein [Microscillaceae bacterium]
MKFILKPAKLFWGNIGWWVLLAGCVPIQSTTTKTGQGALVTSNKMLLMQDRNYEESIKTVVFTLQSTAMQRSLLPPVIPLSQGIPLQLEFDQIDSYFRDYSAKIIHCNADWKPSALYETDYLSEYNDFPIRQYDLSFNTKVGYVHYKFVLPPVKVSGNYVVVVYRTGNPQDVMLSRRFVVYENLVGILPQVRSSTVVSQTMQNQQIDFTIGYTNYELRNPRDEVKVTIRQNYRWDNAIYDLKPLYVRELDKALEYNYFSGENNFKGGNEFRRFDLQSLLYLGFHLEQIDAENPIETRVRLQNDGLRQKEPYVLLPDNNGGFFINITEFANRGDTDADYAKVYFTLKSPTKLPEDVYILGAFNNWVADAQSKMTYFEQDQAYQKSILLKQGLYDYCYAVPTVNQGMDASPIEGSHQNTNNRYDIIVYYRPLGVRADRVIGYRDFNAFN